MVTMVGWVVRPHASPITGGPTRWYLAVIIAAMVWLAALSGVALIALGDARRDWNHALGNTLTLQLPVDTSPARLEVVMALLRQSSGVVSARALESAEIARLLEPWLGKSVPIDILPLPLLVDIQIDGGTLDLGGLEGRVHSVVPEAQLQDHRLWVAGLLSISYRFQVIAAAVVVAAAAVSALSTVTVTGTDLSRDRQLILLLHTLGAHDRDIVTRFVIPAAGTALVGGAAGAIAAAGTLQAIAGAVRNLDLLTQLPSLSDYRVILLLAAVTLAGTIIAAAAAAWVARRRLLQLA